MKKALFFFAIAAMFTLTSCGMGGGSQPVVEEQVEMVEVDSITPAAKPDSLAVKPDTAAVKKVK